MRLVPLIVLALVAGSVVPLVRVSEGTIRGKQREDGALSTKQLWEEAVAAKGGHDRLRAVRNFVVSSTSKYNEAPKEIPGHHIEELFVLPDKWWQWVDHRPGSFGLSIFTFDFGKPIGWEVYSDSPKPRTISTGRDRPRSEDPYQIYDPDAGVKFASNRRDFIERQVIYLMETESVRPIPVGMKNTSKDPSAKIVVETQFGDYRFDFYLDKRSHLPEKVAFRTKLASGREYVEVIELGDYSVVNGIQMPRRVTWGRDEDNRTTYQFAVDYDPHIFEHPPTIDMGPEAWRRK